jgi:hypothetical protein
MESIVDLLKELERSEMPPKVKKYLKIAAQIHVQGGSLVKHQEALVKFLEENNENS